MRKTSTDKLFKLFIYVALITMAISIIVPVGWVFLASLKEKSEFLANPWILPKGFHFQNFIDAFEEAKMGQYLMNSIITTALGLFFLICLSLPAAYVLARFKFAFSKFFSTYLRLGLFVSASYTVIPIFLMVLGWDRYLQELGSTFSFLNNIYVLALIYASTALPFTTFLLASYFQTLPSTFEEAAAIDGAGYFKTMVSVMIPMARPSIITVLLFNFLGFWNEYILAATLLKTEDSTLPVGLVNLIAASKAADNKGRLYAGMIIVMLPTLILYMIVQKRITEGMTVGGSKE